MLNSTVVGILNGLIQGISVSLIILLLTDSNYKTKNKVLLFLFTSLYLIISGVFIPNQLRFFFFIIMSTITTFISLKITRYKCMIYSIFTLLLNAIAELGVSAVIALLGYSSVVQINNIKLNLLFNLLIAITSVLLTLVVKNKLKSITNSLLKVKHLIVIFYMVMFLLYLIVARNALFLSINTKSFINIGILILFVLIFILIIINILKAQQLSEINKQSMQYIEKYEKIITDQGKANHEFKNQLMVIKGYAKINSPKLIEYLDSVIKDTNQMKSTYLISQLNKFPEGGIKGLVYYKLSIMEEEKIKYNIYSDESIKRKAKNLTSEQMKNITKVLGVLLDNAIDECKKMSNKSIDISLISERGKMIFSISNSISDKVDLKRLGTGFTTKGKNHGYGLQLVKDITGSNDYMDYNQNIIDDNYVVNLIIKVSNKKTYKH